ncbi:MAG: peptide-methionine (S)-S-oxide reductase [Methanoregulaceae archaeon]|nr:peptide-methionine (S)-S-oxide reductase [Methanoregulaceae archaeon]
MDDNHQHDVATFAAGCFWDAEARFRRADGVVATKVGYTGRAVSEPIYEQISSGNTSHAEAVNVIFEPSCISTRIFSISSGTSKILRGSTMTACGRSSFTILLCRKKLQNPRAMYSGNRRGSP